MTWVAVAIGGATLVGSVISGNAAQSAANTQAGAQQQASANQLQMFNTINGQEQPFMDAGKGATATLNRLLGIVPGNVGNLQNNYLNTTFDPSSIENSPGYQFAQKQGMQAVQNADAPAVGALSGPAMRDLLNASTGTAEQYYNNYFNQFQSQQQNIFSRLSGLAGLGQNAASNTGTAGTSLGIGAAQAGAAAGASQAAGTVGMGNAIAGGIGNASNYIALNNMLGQGASNGGSMSYSPSAGYGFGLGGAA